MIGVGSPGGGTSGSSTTTVRSKSNAGRRTMGPLNFHRHETLKYRTIFHVAAHLEAFRAISALFIYLWLPVLLPANNAKNRPMRQYLAKLEAKIL